MKTAPARIEIGTAKYDVAIESSKHWESADGEQIREYLTIGKPGIREVANCYLAVKGTTMRSSDIAVTTDAGTVVWTPAGGLTSAKRDAVNAWFTSVLKAS